jgi:hypothetical protein
MAASGPGFQSTGADQGGTVISHGLAIGHNHYVRRRTNESPSTMPRILRVNGADADPVGTADSPDGTRSIVTGLDSGRYYVDDISADPLPSGHTSRRWAVRIKLADGTVIIDPDAWDA